VGLLRGPADRERSAGLPPRSLARLQGHLPPLSDHARLPRRAQGRLGLPRAARGDRRRKELGIQHKAEIEEYGIAEFNARCRESVFTFLEEWNRVDGADRIWLDLDHAYRTLDETYIESVWWALSEIDQRGLLYEGNKVVPYCPRCETTLSSHEVALGYRDVVDPSVFLKLRVADGEEQLLVWTTTRGRSREHRRGGGARRRLRARAPGR